MKIVSFITLLIGVTTVAADATAVAAVAAAISEGDDSRRVGVLHGFKNEVVQEQLNLHHHHHREQDDESVRGALRGFKKEEGEQQKLYYPGHGGQGQGNVVPTNTGYHHWNPANAHGAERWARKDYSLTTDELMKVAYHSKEAARAANETAAAALVRNSADLQAAVGKLLEDATAAEAAACVAVEMLRIANEEDDKDETRSNLLQNVNAIHGIAAAIENQATKTAQSAERAVVATTQSTPNVKEVNSITVHTKAQAKATLKMVESLVTMMITNAGGGAPGQDSLIDTSP